MAALSLTQIALDILLCDTYYANMQIKYKVTYRQMVDIRVDLAQFIKERNLTQTELSSITKVNQGQISRILSGANVRVSSAVIRLCKYANINPHLNDEYELTPELIEALRLVVGQNPSRAHTVARVIRALVD
jgi:predicted XRE-type DNA-binding protein